MSLTPSSRTLTFIKRIEQIIDFYNLSPQEFAQTIAIEPADLTNLLEKNTAEPEVLLSIIDGIQRKLRLQLDWFLDFDLEATPDIRECLNTLLYERDVTPKRQQARAEGLRFSLRDMIDELVLLAGPTTKLNSSDLLSNQD